MNGVTFQNPSVPVLLQILNGADPQGLLPNGSVYYLPRNKVIQISVPGGSIGAPHPFHLHGVSDQKAPVVGLYLIRSLAQHRFSVIRSAGESEYNYSTSCCTFTLHNSLLIIPNPY